MKNYRVMNKSGLTIDESTVNAFIASLNGEVVRAGDSAYEKARTVWNGMIDKYPSMIVYCAVEQDVVHAVQFADSNDLLAAVRSGGHNVAGNSVCDNGVVIDLSRMKHIEVDAAARTVRVQAGLTLGELDAGTHPAGLATPLGIVSKTGLAGLTIGGGIGWLMRKYGLTCDNLLSARVVTADARVVIARAEENADLFWGIRGGGGNFGIVTEFTFALHPVKDVLGGSIFFPADRGREILLFFRDYIASVPDELGLMLAFMKESPPFMHKHLQGPPMIAVHACYTGPFGRGEEILKPLRTFGQAISDTIRVMPYIDLQSMLDSGAPSGLQNYWKSSYLDSFSDPVIEAILSHVSEMPSPLSQVHIQHLGGAVGRVAENSTAFSNRSSLCVVNIVTKWIDQSDSEINIQWTRDLAAVLKPFASGEYVNFMGDEGQEGALNAYSRENYARLVMLKNKFDPHNFFSLNQNIRPLH